MACPMPRDAPVTSAVLPSSRRSMACTLDSIGGGPRPPSIVPVNRLADETSPYLRQHADEPGRLVPWGDEAFDLARRLGPPGLPLHRLLGLPLVPRDGPRVVRGPGHRRRAQRGVRLGQGRPRGAARRRRRLHGGGAGPHRLGRMADERLPHPRPPAVLRRHLLPPRDRARHHRRSAPCSRALRDAWDNRRDEVDQQADELCRAMAARTRLPGAAPAGSAPAPPAAPGGGPDLLDRAADDLASRFDPAWGGFGRAPKFPQPASVDLRPPATPWATGAGRGANARARWPTATLDAMAAGGIHDHLGGGFARYSTDDRWLVPHFEKMLYDQAGAAPGLPHGWQVTGRADYRVVMDGIVGYVGRDLTGPEGGVCSAEDADSEGEEGRFYAWTLEEVARAVGGSGPGSRRSAEAVARFFGIEEGGNWEGRSILWRPPGAPLTGDPDVESGRRLLLDARSRRPRPGLGTTRSSPSGTPCTPRPWPRRRPPPAVPDWATRRRRASGEFLLERLRRRPTAAGCRSWQRERRGAPPGLRRRLRLAGGLLHPVGRAHRRGPLDRGTPSGPPMPCSPSSTTPKAAVFFTTGHDAEALVVRTKELFDGATPSANAVAALALARLAALTGEDRYRRAARGVVDHVRPAAGRAPGRLRPHRASPPSSLVGRLDRGGGHRRPARPGAGGARALAARRRAGLGRADRLPAVAGAGARPCLRLPVRHLPAAGRRPGDALGAARRSRARGDTGGEPALEPHATRRHGPRRRPVRRADGRASRWPVGPRSPCWCWPATTRTPSGSTSPRGPWSGSGWPGPTGTTRTSPPSTWSRPSWPTSPSGTTWPSPRRSPPRGCPATSGPCTGGGCAASSTAWRPRSRSTCSASRAPRPPTGSSGASAPRSPCSSRTRARCSSAGCRTGRCGSGSDGDGATTGCPSRTGGPSGPSTWPAGTGWPARTWPPRSGSSPTTCWPPSPPPVTATATRRCGRLLPRS